MAIPKYHLIFEIADIVGIILDIVGIVIGLVIEYFQVKQDLAPPCTSSSIVKMEKIPLGVGVHFLHNISNLPSIVIIDHTHAFAAYQTFPSFRYFVPFVLSASCDSSRSLFACSCPITGNSFGSSKPI